MKPNRGPRLAAGLVALAALGACGGDGGGAPGSQETTRGGTGCATTVTLTLEADRGPIDSTFEARGGGAYVDPNGEFHVVFGDQPFELAGQQPDDLVTVAMQVPLQGAAPAATTYTSADDGLNLDVSRSDAEGSITSSFGLEGTGDEVSMEITELGDDFLCATVLAASNPETGGALDLSGTIEVPYGDFADL
jgi:hypothetical protein